MNQRPTFVGLFAVCGGLSLGMASAVFRYFLLNEMWKIASEFMTEFTGSVTDVVGFLDCQVMRFRDDFSLGELFCGNRGLVRNTNKADFSLKGNL